MINREFIAELVEVGKLRQLTDESREVRASFIIAYAVMRAAEMLMPKTPIMAQPGVTSKMSATS